jgi:hypothetical protein
MSTLTEASEAYLWLAARSLSIPPEIVLEVIKGEVDDRSVAYRVALTHYMRRRLHLSYPKIAYLLNDGGHTTPLMRNSRPCSPHCRCEPT